MARDPVCGMSVSEPSGLALKFDDKTFYFCSPYCRQLFEKEPTRYASGAGHVAHRPTPAARTIAYFSMEIGLTSAVPTYSGGLGVLAGDTLRSCADLQVPVLGVTLLYRRGYFRQEIDASGNQRECAVEWNPQDHFKLLPARVEVELEGRRVQVAAWQYDIMGVTDSWVPVILLDTDLVENDEADRSLTHALYGGDARHRLMQETILGIGGVRMLRVLGYSGVRQYHMNEGHASLLALEVLRETGGIEVGTSDFESVRRSCVFTTHTPVPAGHDRFPYPLVESVLGHAFPLDIIQMLGGEGELNMTLLALNMSHYVNGVAKRHGEVSREMFPTYTIDSITNGVHSATWTCDSFRALFDQYIPGWRADPFSLRYSLSIDKREIWQAHRVAKASLLRRVKSATGVDMDEQTLTIGFARRATPYKRNDLVFADMDRLRHISKHAGRLQLVFAGKAHPRDEGGKDLIRRVMAAAQELKGQIRIAYLPDYDMEMARQLVSGTDLWLNTPRRPMEASGTSGMKAAHNGVPSLSILDGWWIEGCIEGITGWSIGTAGPDSGSDAHDAQELYDKLEGTIVPLYYHNRSRWIDMMRHVIALNASFFNTHRMVQQYVLSAYREIS